MSGNRIFQIALVALVLFFVALRSLPAPETRLQVAPLVQEAVRAYRSNNPGAIDALLVRLDGLKPADAAPTEIQNCTDKGALLRRIALARVQIDYLDSRGAAAMNEVPRYLYFEELSSGRARLQLGEVTQGWPSGFQCEKEPGFDKVARQDSAEENAARDAILIMAKAWHGELEAQMGPKYLRLELERAAKLLYANHMRANGFY